MVGVLEIAVGASCAVTLVTVAIACVCGCRKDSHNELIGTQGVVKRRIDDESPPLVSRASPLASKRVPNRSLPEIPPSVVRHDSGDAQSDLYATVTGVERITSPSEIVVETSETTSTAEHHYARLQNAVPSVESTTENERPGKSISPVPPIASDESQHATETSTLITASNAITGQVSSSNELPYMTPPVLSTAPSVTGNEERPVVHRTDQHFSGDSVDSAKGYTSISVREPLSFIRPTANLRGAQPHYATVSDDSDEMYAAIEDPSNQVYTSGSETYAQIQPPNLQPANSSGTQTVTPATIPSTISTSNMSNAASNITSSQPSTENVQPHSKNLIQESSINQIGQSHARQASNSSHSESVGTLGSPKPEKRQANSPLPPPPSVSETTSTVTVPHKKSHDSPSHRKKSSKHHKLSSTGNLHELRRSLNEKHQRNNSCVSSSDFYGCNYPVDKHRFSSGDLVRPLVAREIDFSSDKTSEQKSVDAIYNTIDGPNDIYAAIDQEPSRKSLTLSQPNVTSGSPNKNVEEMYAKVIKKPKSHPKDHHSQPSSLSNYEDSNPSKSEYNANIQPSRKQKVKGDSKRHSGSNQTSASKDSSHKHNTPGTILNVQLLEKDDPGYETIDKSGAKSHGYETISKIKTAKSNDPGYETVKELNKNVDAKKPKSIPTVSGGLMHHSHNSADMLQRIVLHDNRTSPVNEPNYETVPGGPDSLLSNDPGYEHIRRLERYASDSDPNYEQLLSRHSTPPYASLRDRSSNAIPNYSVINKPHKSTEQNWASNNNDNFASEPNYESMPHEPAYNTGSESDPNYESVGPKDPNYESVKYFNVSAKEPPYERVKNDTANDMTQLQRNNSSAGYEKIKPAHKREKGSDDNNDNKPNGASLSYVAENGSVSDYFQV